MVTRSDGHTETSSAAVLVVEYRPIITQQPAATTTVHPGQAVTLTVAADGVPPPSFRWELNGEAIDGATGPSLTLPAAAESDEGVYVAVAYNSRGARSSQEALVLVDDPPHWIAQPADVTANPGDHVVLTAVVGGQPYPTMQWYRNGLLLPGEVFPSLVLGEVRESAEGNYTLALSNSVGNAISRVVAVVVNDPPALVAQPAAVIRVNPGQLLTLSLAATGTHPLSFQWFKNGELLASASGPTLQAILKEEEEEGEEEEEEEDNGGEGDKKKKMMMMMTTMMMKKTRM